MNAREVVGNVKRRGGERKRKVKEKERGRTDKTSNNSITQRGSVTLPGRASKCEQNFVKALLATRAVLYLSLAVHPRRSTHSLRKIRRIFEEVSRDRNTRYFRGIQSYGLCHESKNHFDTIPPFLTKTVK